MTTTILGSRSALRLRLALQRFGMPALALIGVLLAAALISRLGHPHPHAPDMALLRRQPPIILVHLATALFALGLGAVMMLAPKGTLPHRTLGWVWVTLIMTVAASSIFIRNLNHGGFSAIHALSAWVLFIVPVGVWAARRHKVIHHRRVMTGVFYLGLIVAGAFTFVPGRLMWTLLLG